MSSTLKNREEAKAWHERYESLAPKVGKVAGACEEALQYGLQTTWTRWMTL